jgi:hypothetical protein
LRKAYIILVALGILLVFYFLTKEDDRTNKDLSADSASGDEPTTTGNGPFGTSDTPGASDPSSARARSAEMRSRNVIVEVINSAGQPIGGAIVQPVNTGVTMASSTSNPDGIAEFPHLPLYASISVTALGYKEQTQAQPAFGDAKEVLWTITLASSDEHPRAILGWVTSSGEPVADALIVLEEKSSPPKDSKIIGKTNAKGRFIIADPPERVTHINALHSLYGEATRPLKGETEVLIELPGGVFVEGKVLDATGKPLPQFSIRADRRKGPSSPFLRSTFRMLRKDTKHNGRERKWARNSMKGLNQKFNETNGQFTIGPIGPGQLSVYAHAPGYQPDEAQTFNLEAGETQSGVTFRLEIPLVVEGRVTDRQTGAPISGAIIRTAGWGYRKIPGFGQAISNSNGRFVLHTINGKRHGVRVSAKGYFPLDEGGFTGASGETTIRDFSLKRSSRKRKGRHNRTREYVGVGITIKKNDDGIMVQSLLPNSPSQGLLQKGDILLMADGVWLDDLPLHTAAQTMLGEPETDVELLFHRPDPNTGAPTEKTVTVRRQRITHQVKH